MKHLILAFLLGGLLACSDDQSATRTAKNNGGTNDKADSLKPVTERKNTTEYGVCGTGTSTLTSPEGRWEMFESAEGFYYKVALEFSSGKLTLRQDCFYKAHRLTSSVTVPTTYDRGIIWIQADATDVQKAEDKDGKFECKVNLVKDTNKYGFSGHCLELYAFQGRKYLKFAPQ